MKTLFAFFVLLLVIPANAGVIDEIAALEKHKTAAGNNPTQHSPAPKAKPQTFRLSNGQAINITHWQIVHFMKSDCQYCQQFNPVLNATAQQRGIPVFVYSFDGLGDSTFSNVLPVTPDVIGEFFPELPQVTPTDFIINTQTLVAIPVSQGMMSATAFVNRLEQSFRLAEKLGVLQ
ncbi:type-F conjugative transfer system pilin assembly thiol-disulfide isomerase TrbB [Arsenophonus sp.]|uniref:type-F conjugative transfer system pilin assembly thiol-disulfide isomerase TrbB n=1 Tax=Arsenophonus sp. TaxID=1872640 RepID=UPI00285C8438|nr:type-F conjugative transfer system pilin assembly thiol-disulfide isomerase TrbB [Arsenophonus sp.]MDR5614291.1 type-F conjugative transfer system pilin assembly thiol-disulfide isomerase TrbB [Arsenophonus sp.]